MVEPKKTPPAATDIIDGVPIFAVRTGYKNEVNGANFMKLGQSVTGVLCSGQVTSMVLKDNTIKVTVRKPTPNNDGFIVKNFYLTPPFYADEA